MYMERDCYLQQCKRIHTCTCTCIWTCVISKSFDRRRIHAELLADTYHGALLLLAGVQCIVYMFLNER